METNFEIRQATIEDVPLILAFITELASYEKLLNDVVVTIELLREHLFGKTPRAEVVIAYINKQPVGFALFFHNFSTFLGRPGLYLEDLYVKPEARGNQVGFKLLSYLAHIAKKRNCGRIEWSVLDWNQSAIDFYKKIGAKAMDEWTVYRISGQTIIDLANHWQK